MSEGQEDFVTLKEEHQEVKKVITEDSLKEEGFLPEEIAKAKENGFVSEEEKDEDSDKEERSDDGDDDKGNNKEKDFYLKR